VQKKVGFFLVMTRVLTMINLVFIIIKGAIRLNFPLSNKIIVRELAILT
jgi:hypothetical protein